MGGDNDDGSKWFVAGGLRQAKRHHDANKKQGSAGQVEGAGAGTSHGSAKINCHGFGHLQHQCPSKVGMGVSYGK